MQLLKEKLEMILSSGSSDKRRPVLGRGNKSNVRGLHIIGDLAGAPLIKLAMAQGVEIIDYLADHPDMQRPAEEPVLDLLTVGAGDASLNTALAANEKGMSYVVLEKGKIANIIE